MNHALPPDFAEANRSHDSMLAGCRQSSSRGQCQRSQRIRRFALWKRGKTKTLEELLRLRLRETRVREGDGEGENTVGTR